MSKVRELLTTIPGRLNLNGEAGKRASKALELIFDYDANKVGDEFKRLGNSLEDCGKRLDTIFGIIDGMVLNYDGDVEAAKEGKKLLLLASTPDSTVHNEIIDKYGDSNESFSDVMTIDESIVIGEAGWWNDGDSARLN